MSPVAFSKPPENPTNPPTSLEHVCRDHFHPSLFDPPPPSTVFPTPLIGHEANGHTLMASSRT